MGSVNSYWAAAFQFSSLPSYSSALKAWEDIRLSIAIPSLLKGTYLSNEPGIWACEDYLKDWVLALDLGPSIILELVDSNNDEGV